ncbi:hypothetical protein QQS21_005161 [Conoideocrella luteorostrata]|uniref:SnoaL-like domain-containing protein n=1 Tax=Conoideocrella luteorostrata TaxID=1105319 RepID=A0AAJ0FZB2_9HYPO|nr:hypothetical protein QQS21_005161 [Conoideocrella luteorostrata]
MHFATSANPILLALAGATNSSCPPFPPSLTAYSSHFAQPLPPMLQSEFQTHLIQHKWNENVSHITAGYMYNSPSRQIVRVDETFENAIASSIFDYKNITEEGLVDNILTSVNSNFAHPTVFRGYVNSNFPLIGSDFLANNSAVFTGMVNKEFSGRDVASWSIMYQGAIPVTLFVDECGVVRGYDYFSTGERTRVTMSFFNVRVGKVDI